MHLKVDTLRGQWSNKREYLLSCFGAAVGLGNIWRFPYLCYKNGGGAFLLPYLLMLFLCGIPLFYLESSLGQFASASCLTVFKIAPLFKGVGYAILVVNFISTCYYVVVVSYPLSFIYESFAPVLSWMDCNNTWNTNECLPLYDENSTNLFFNESLMYNNSFMGEGQQFHRTPADEFFHKKILQLSSSIDETGEIVSSLLIFNGITWIIIYLCVMKGVKGVGKVVYFTVTFPCVILIVLFVRGSYTPWGFSRDIFLYLSTMGTTLQHSGCGWGSIINMASYNPFNNNNKNDAILIPLCNCITSIFAGFVVFAILGYVSERSGLPISKVATGGPGLAFVTYPEAIALLPYPQLWSILFFVMLFLIGLDSCFVPLESMISTIVDEYEVLRKYKTILSFIICVVMFLCSAIFVTNSGMYYIQLFDFYAPSLALVTISFCELLIVGWTYGINNFARDVQFMNRNELPSWWLLCWRFIAPLILAGIIVTTLIFYQIRPYNGVNYPAWSISLGWAASLSSVCCIPVYMGYKLLYYTEGDLFERITQAVKPGTKWGPKQPHFREQWLYMVYKKRVIKMSHLLEDTKLDPLHQSFLSLSAEAEDTS